MISFLCAALVFSLASAEPQSTSSQAALDTETATRLVNGWPGLSPSTGRRLVSVKAGGENAAGVGFIEFRFTDGGASRTAVGFAAPSSAMANNKSKVIAEYRGWALARVLEDKTLDDVIEGLRQARTTANEAAALGRLRSVVSGQMAFSTANEGFFSTPECLTEDAKCLPPGPGRGVAFLSPGDAALGERSGYRYRFSPGAAARPVPGRPISSPSFVTFAVTAVPIAPGETGDLGFCADDSGNICAAFDGSEPAIAGGRCAFPCPAAAAAMNGLKAPSASKRDAAARALGKMADRTGAEALSAALRAEADAGVRRTLVNALVSAGGPVARSAVFEALKDVDGEVRLVAARGLPELSPAPSRPEASQIVAVVRPFLDHSEARARMDAVSLLGKLGQASDRAAIKARLEDADEYVRRTAEDALKELDERTAKESPRPKRN